MRKRKAKSKNKRVVINQRQRSQRRKRQKRKYPTRKKLVVLLGAGFSVPAKLPIAKVLNATFNRDLRDKLLCISSSEWEWIDTVTYDIIQKDLNIKFHNKSDIHIHNGRINNDHLAYSYILNELVKKYKADKRCFVDYEDFFQYAIDIESNQNEISELYQKAEEQLHIDFPVIQEQYLKPFQNTNYRIIIDILNYLITDLLFHNLSTEELSHLYNCFLNFVGSFEMVEIFTLNHDIILESIFEYKKISYTKGFRRKTSEIGYNNTRLPVFNSRKIGNHKVKLFKLHGSINTYGFKHAYKIDGMHYLTNKISYFTGNYDEKQYAYRIEKKTGKKVQELNFDIVPKFITGKRKSEIIKNDLMYSFLYNCYNKSIINAQTILISGYSFGDKHIDKKLEKSKCNLVINQNPNTKYPFTQKHININYLNELYSIKGE